MIARDSGGPPEGGPVNHNVCPPVLIALSDRAVPAARRLPGTLAPTRAGYAIRSEGATPPATFAARRGFRPGRVATPSPAGPIPHRTHFRCVPFGLIAARSQSRHSQLATLAPPYLTGGYWRDLPALDARLGSSGPFMENGGVSLAPAARLTAWECSRTYEQSGFEGAKIRSPSST